MTTRFTRRRLLVWALAMLATISAVGAVVLYSYVNVGAIGPLQNMSEPSWKAPGELVSAYFEGAGGLLSVTGLLFAMRAHRDPTRRIPGVINSADPGKDLARAGSS